MPASATATDPLGNTVHLLQEVYFTSNSKEELYDDVTEVKKNLLHSLK